MQVIRLVLLAAAAGARALASFPHVDITHEMRGLGDPLVLAARATASAAGAASVSAAGNNKNLQTFTGALGGIKADAVVKTSDTQRPFNVDGSTFPDFESAAGRSCDNQMNSCAQAANAKTATGFTVNDCNTQNTQCKANISAAAAQSTAAVSSSSVASSTSTSSSSTSTSTSTSLSLSTSATSTAILATSTIASIASTTTSATLALVSQNAQFNFFCEV